jgi:hypothetical protein
MRFKLFLIIFIIAFSSIANAQCKSGKIMVKASKAEMKPYNMDAYVDNELIYGKQPKTIETPFTAYSGESYKLIFASDNVPQGISIGIYDKNKRAKTRKELYKYDFKVGDTRAPVFEIKKPGNYYIQFDVPPSDDEKVLKKGCMYTMIGFKENE